MAFCSWHGNPCLPCCGHSSPWQQHMHSALRRTFLLLLLMSRVVLVCGRKGGGGTGCLTCWCHQVPGCCFERELDSCFCCSLCTCQALAHAAVNAQAKHCKQLLFAHVCGYCTPWMQLPTGATRWICGGVHRASSMATITGVV